MALRQPHGLLRSLRLPCTSTRINPSSSRPLQTNVRFYAAQSYGDGQGDPKGENPSDQGTSPATSNAEHPGPAPPDVGNGSGEGPTKGGSGGHGSGESSTQGEEVGRKKQTSGGPLSEAAAQPKIHQETPPHLDNQSDDVKAHNADMANRHEKPHEGSRDDGEKVDKKFWQGQGGADRDP